MARRNTLASIKCVHEAAGDPVAGGQDAPFGDSNLSAYDKKWRQRRDFLKELLSNEHILELMTAMAFQQYLVELQAAAVEGKLLTTSLGALRASAKAIMDRLAYQAAIQTGQSMSRAVGFGQNVVLEQIKKAVSPDIFARLSASGVEFPDSASVAAELAAVGSDSGNLADKIVAAADQTALAISKDLTIGVVNGQNVSSIASNVQRNITGAGAGEGVAATTRGSYKSFFGNAARIARTELAYSFSEAVSRFGENKDWIIGYEFNLSASHPREDICDDYDGEILSKDDFDLFPPIHENCRCSLSIVLDQELLANELAQD